jgi:hypothetical protein
MELGASPSLLQLFEAPPDLHEEIPNTCVNKILSEGNSKHLCQQNTFRKSAGDAIPNLKIVRTCRTRDGSADLPMCLKTMEERRVLVLRNDSAYFPHVRIEDFRSFSSFIATSPSLSSSSTCHIHVRRCFHLVGCEKRQETAPGSIVQQTLEGKNQ